MRTITAWLTIIFSLFLITGCSTRPPAAPPTYQNQGSPPEPDNPEAFITNLESHLSPLRRIIVKAAIQNIGKPYAWGGQSPEKGFDCSGLVVYTHGKAGIMPPRTAKKQYKSGKPVTKPDLIPGDLVFFNVSKKNNFHVGIFIGNSWFVHAPGKGRKIISASLKNPYFKEHYQGGRSFL